MNPIDLKQIQKKAKNYKSFSELREDISWFKHNCKIHQPSSRTVLKASDEIEKYVDDEISSIQTCTECYVNASENPRDSFVMTCQQVHPIVWAKTDGYHYWPAKVMFNQNESVHVRYFGDHSVSTIPVQNCYLFSSEPPETVENQNSDLYEDAIEVCGHNVK